jgi:urease accessory protein
MPKAGTAIIIMTTMMTTLTEDTLTEGGLYRLLAWLSPSFPVGAFSYSHGIEAAVEAGRVRDRGSLEAWVGAILCHGTGRIDADLLRDSWRAVAEGETALLMSVTARADAHRGTAETALESRAQGQAFLQTARAAWPHPVLDAWALALAAEKRPPSYAVAIGVAAACVGVPLAAALTAYLHGAAANLVSAGLRLIPLGQTDGQRALRTLEPVVAAGVAAALVRGQADFGGCALAVELASIDHETQYTRLFRS